MNQDDLKVLEQRFTRADETDALEFFKEPMDAYEFASALSDIRSDLHILFKFFESYLMNTVFES